MNGENYLIPVGALIEDEYDVDIEGIRASSLLKTLEDAKAALNIVILDACRNNPFKTSSRSAQQGLAKMDAPTGTLLAYSTAPGQVAEDGSGANSAYTRALSLAIRRPGVTVEQGFERVRIEVMTRTLDEQVPWESSSLTGDFYFSGVGNTQQITVAASQTTQSAPAVDKETIFWQSIQGSEDAGDYEAYLKQYPEGSFAALAQFRVKKLRDAEVIVAASPAKPQPSTSSKDLAVGESQITALPARQVPITSFNGKWAGKYTNMEGTTHSVPCNPSFKMTLNIKGGKVTGYLIWSRSTNNSTINGSIDSASRFKATIFSGSSGHVLDGTAKEGRLSGTYVSQQGCKGTFVATKQN